MSSSSSGSIATDKLASLASSTSESVMTMKGFGRLGSSNTESCAWSWSDPASQGFGVGEGGASIRQGAFIREGRLIETIHLKGGVY